MRLKTLLLTLLIALLGLQSASAQIPGATTATTTTTTTAAGTASATQVTTVWDKLGLGHANLAKCRARFCASGIGQMAKAMASPMVGMTGGLIGPCCTGVPTAAELAALAVPGAASPAEAAAAKIKADEAGAAARRAAVRYLGTVDCHYYPEAEEALIAALRADRNECVRLEAALVLGSGCCCTRKTIAALTIVVSGSDKDGNPSETSERVKHAASQSLHRCMSFPIVTPEPLPPEPPPAARLFVPGAIQQANYVPSLSVDPLLQQAQRHFAENVSAPKVQTGIHTGQRNLVQIMQFAAHTEKKTAQPVVVQLPTPPVSAVQHQPLRPLGQIPPDGNLYR